MRGAPWGLAVLLSSAAAQASLPDIAALGARGPALGGTGVSSAQGYEATYQNPAGLIGAPRALTVGAVYGGFSLKLDRGAVDLPDASGLLIGASLPLPLGGVMRERLALGVGFYLPFGVINRAREPFPEVPRPALLANRAQVVSVLLGAGARLPGGFSVGAGVLALAALVGDIVIQPDSSGRITAASQQQLTVDYAPIVGGRFTRGPLQIGAVLRGASQSSYRIVVLSKLGSIVPIGLPDLIFAGVAQYDPLQAGAEASLRPLPPLLLTAGLTWKHWSAYTPPVEPATEAAPALPTADFHDTAVPRVAAEYTAPLPPHAGTLQLRLGYFFEWSPAPIDDEEARSLLDADRHVVTLGLGYQAPGRIPLRVDAFGQWHQLTRSQRLTGGFGIMGLALGVNL